MAEVTATTRTVSVTTYVFWFAAFCVTSAGMTIGNKVVMKEFRAPYTLLGFQQVVAVSVYVALHFAIGQHDVKSMWHIKPVTLPQVRRLLIIGVNFTFILATSLKALPLVTVATVVVFRNLCTCVVALIEHLVMGESFSWQCWAALLVTVVGSLVYAGTDINFNPEGYCWQVLNSAVFCFGQLYEKWNMTRTTDQTAVGVALIKALFTFPIVMVLVPLFGEVEYLRSLESLQVTTVVLAFVTGLGAIGMGLIYMTLYQIATATASTVAGNFNKVVSIIVGSWVFSSSLSSVQMIGLVVCMSGSFWWSLESLKRKPAATGGTSKKDS